MANEFIIRKGYKSLSSSEITGSLNVSVDIHTPDVIIDGHGSVSASLSSIIANDLDGAGTANYISKFTDTDTLADSIIFDSGTNIGIGILTDGTSKKLTVAGEITGSDIYINGWNSISSSLSFISTTHTNFSASVSTRFEGLTTDYTELDNIPDNIISSSLQVDHDQTTNFVAGEHFLQSGIITVGTVTTGNVTAILPANTVSSSAQIASDISGSITSFSGSVAARFENNESSIGSLTGATGSYLLNTTDTLTGDLTVTGTVTAQEFHTEIVSASIIYESGSSKFGDSSDDNHDFTGSLNILGNITSTGDIDADDITIDDWGSVSASLSAIQTAGGVNGTGTANRIAIWSDSDTLTSNSGLTFTTGHILVNQGTEYRSKDTAGSVRTLMRVNNSNELEYGWSSNGAVKFMGGGSYTERMRIHTDGNVGIGTTNPITKLNVAGDIAVTTTKAFRMYNAANTGWGEIRFVESDNRIQFNRGIQNSGVDWRLSEDSASSYVSALQGNFGIGTTSPGKKLDVNGEARVNSILTLNRASVASLKFSRGSDFYLGIDNSGNLNFLNNAASSLGVWKNNGNVGIGTTAPGEKLVVAESIDNDLVTLKIENNFGNSSVNGTGTALQFYGWDAGVTANIKSIRTGQSYSPSALTFETFGGNGTIGSNSLAERMRIDEFGNVGIGTINPSTHLDVVGNTRIGTDSEHAFQITDDSTNNFLILSSTQRATASAARDIKFRSYGTDATDSVLVMDMSSGNVGVGIDTPNYPLEVNGTSTVSIAYQRTGVSAKKWGFHSDNGNTYWQNLTDGNLALTISNAGNVGIGTTGPSSLSANTTSLSINSTRTDLTGGIFLKANGTNKAQYYWDSSGQVNETLAGDIRWFVGNTERMRIKSTGNVGIGTSNPIYPLEVQSGGVGTVLRAGTSFVSIDSVGTASSPSLIFNGDDNTGIFRAASDTLGFSTGGSERLRITSTGDIGIGTTSPVGDLHLYGGQQNIVLTNTNADGVTGLTISRIIGQARGYSNNLSVMQSIDFVTNATAWYKGDIVFRTNSIDGTDTTKTAAERMRINAAGNVGIGTSNPGSKLQVSGDIDSDDITIDGWGSVSGSLASIATAGGVNGSGTTNDVVMWSGANSIADAPIAISGNNATFAGDVNMASAKVESDGAAAAGAYLELHHNNNNSTDVCATLNLTNNAGGYASIVGGTTGANNTGYIEFKTDNAGTQGTVLTLNGDNSATFAGNVTLSGQVAPQLFLDSSTAGTPNYTLIANASSQFIIGRAGISNDFILNSGNATFAGNVVLGDSSNTTMATGAPGQLKVKGSGYTGAVALDATAMYIYHDSSIRDLVLGTNETARLTISGNSGNTVITGNVAMASGNATGKFAVMSSAVHGSYDFYNNGTTYLNGSTYVDAAFTQSGGADSTFSGAVYFTAQGVAGKGSINLENDDPFIRLHDNGSGSTTDKKKWDIRAIGATGYESFDIRTVNDANTVFSTKLSIAHNGNATLAGNVSIGGNLIGASNNTTELGTYTTGAIKRIRMAQGGEIHFGDTTTTAPLGITEGNWDSFSDQDRLSIYGRSSIKFYAGSTTAVLAATLQSTGLTLNTITNATSDTDKFLVSDSGIIKYRTGAELLSDIGAVATSTLGSYLPLTAGSTKKLTDTLYIQGTNTTNAESVLVRGVSSNDGDWLGSIRTANTGGYNQEMRFYTSDADGTTNENLTLTLSPNKNATFAGNGTFDTSLKINAPDGGGAPAMTAILNMHGYEGRGVGIKMKDNVNSAAGSTDREWFIGTGYSNSGFNIGYAANGSQSSYNAQAKLSIGTNGDALFSNNVTVTGDLTVNGTTTTINTATVEVEDNIIVLNKTASDGSATAAQSGISINRGGSTADASFIFDDTDDFWDLTHNLNVATDIQAQDLGLGVNPVRFGTGVPTLHLKGTSSTNGRGGAIRFQEFDGTDTTALYSTDGGDGYGTVLCAYQGSIKLATGALTGTVLELDQSNNATFAGNVGIGDAPDENGFGLEIHKDGDDDSIGILIHNKGTDSLDDAKISFETQGQRDISIGIDRSDSFFKISHSGDLGTNDWQTFDASGNVTFAGNIVLPGEESNSFKIAFTGASASSGLSTVDQSGAGLYIGANSRVNNSGNVVYHDSALPSSGIYFDGWNGDDMEFYTGASGNPSKRLSIFANGDANFTGNVGIGTTNPLLKLHITGTNSLPATSGTTPNGGIRIENGANNGVLDIGASNATGAPGWIQSTDKADLSQTYKLLLNPNGGNVGVGTTNPSNPFHVYSVGVNEGIFMEGTGGGHWFNFKSGTSNLWSMGAQTGLMGWYNRTSANLGYKMVILDEGNVGIGTTSPDQKLQVDGNIRIPNGGKIVFGTPGTTPDDYLELNDITATGSLLKLVQDTNTRFVIQGVTGNVGIGTDNPSSKLEVISTSNAEPHILVKKQTTGGSAEILFEHNSGVTQNASIKYTQNGDNQLYITTNYDSPNDLNRIYFQPGGETAMTIRGGSNATGNAGNVGIGTTSPVSKLQVVGGIQMADDTATASADKVGTMRYRTGTEFVEVTGTELIPQPLDFSSDWTSIGSTTTITTDTFTTVTSAGGIRKSGLFTVGQVYRAVISGTTTSTNNQINNFSNNSNYKTWSGAGAFNFTFTFTATTDDGMYLRLYPGTAEIYSLSVTEVTAEDASYADMCMQTGASTYEWVNIVRNTY